MSIFYSMKRVANFYAGAFRKIRFGIKVINISNKNRAFYLGAILQKKFSLKMTKLDLNFLIVRYLNYTTVLSKFRNFSLIWSFLRLNFPERITS